jgi:putative transposase
MSRYRRALVPGGTFFFTVTLADRQSTALVEHIDRLRAAYRRVQLKHPFQTLAICVLPDHLHTIWSLPEGDANYPLRRRLIKAGE